MPSARLPSAARRTISPDRVLPAARDYHGVVVVLGGDRVSEAECCCGVTAARLWSSAKCRTRSLCEQPQ